MFLSSALTAKLATKPLSKGMPKPREVLKSLPKFVVTPAKITPFVLQKPVVSKLLYALFEESLSEGDVDFLKGKWLKLDVCDVGISLQFSCGENREVMVRKDGMSDVCIRGVLKSFVLLAAQKEDPDTLFFQRDLVIEGDTDLGLEIKNLLGGLELDSLPPELIFLIRSGAEYMNAFC